MRINSGFRFKRLKQAGSFQEFAGLHVAAFKGFVMRNNQTTYKGKIGKQILGRLKQRYCNNLKWNETAR